ncbi:hypothetical protein E2320_005630 [Naja naja]|nr:hypothetical protein E2320_005630 [Naja naja]
MGKWIAHHLLMCPEVHQHFLFLLSPSPFLLLPFSFSLFFEERAQSLFHLAYYTTEEVKTQPIPLQPAGASIWQSPVKVFWGEVGRGRWVFKRFFSPKRERKTKLLLQMFLKTFREKHKCVANNNTLPTFPAVGQLFCNYYFFKGKLFDRFPSLLLITDSPRFRKALFK